MTALPRTLIVATVGLFATTTTTLVKAQDATPTPGAGTPPIIASGDVIAMPAPLPLASPFPSLSRKTKEIFALRELHAHRFSTANARAVLPLLKNLLAAEKNAQIAAEKALDEERNALLQLELDAPPPMNSGAQVQVEMERFRQAGEKVWFDIQKSVGEDKALTLERLAGRFRPAMLGNGMGGMIPGVPISPGGTPFPGGAGSPTPQLLPGTAPQPKPEAPKEGSSDSGTVNPSGLVAPSTPVGGGAGLSDATIPVESSVTIEAQTPGQPPKAVPSTPAGGSGVVIARPRGKRDDPSAVRASSRQFQPLMAGAFPSPWGTTLSLRELVDLLEAKVSVSRAK